MVCRMSAFRIALANPRFPATPAESVALAERAIAEAAVERAGIVCFPVGVVRQVHNREELVTASSF